MIKTDEIEISAADLGDENPLPDINDNLYIHATYKLTDKIKPNESKYIGKGMINTLLPYTFQDGYNRIRTVKKFKTVVVENKYLKAVFLPDFGGRLWQLYDKKEGRDLIYVNPVFQPCNLALRNAWFSGGVEFNVSIKGHNPFTCAPLYAEKRVDRSGKEFLSMYEWERIRGVVYSVNVYLPEDSKVLYIKNVIENTDDKETFMYWWSNIAVPETPETRIIVPANKSFISFYDENHYVLDKTGIPDVFGVDASYPINLNRSLDFFYKIPEKNDKWIASADSNGKGLLHFSDDKLKSRKLFLWGTANGGRHWNEFLSVKNSAYIEIQAGLMNTQLEHFVMPPNSKIEFTEAYASLNGDSDRLHGSYNSAIECVSETLYGYTCGVKPKKYLKSIFPEISKSKTVEIYNKGSGWGYLENLARKISGKKRISNIFNGFTGDGCVEKWEKLAVTGKLPASKPSDIPNGYVTDKFFTEKLKDSVRNYPDDFAAHLYLGVALYAAGFYDKANKEWEKSYQSMPNAWAYRNSASYFVSVKNDYVKGKELILKALNMMPENDRIAIACGKILVDGGFCEEWLNVYDGFNEKIKNVGRIRLLRAKALIALGRLEEAEEIINKRFEMPDIKEGELSVSALWFELYKKKLMRDKGLREDEAISMVAKEYPLPYELDFRMHG